MESEMPVDTFTPEEQAMAEESQVPDDQMEEDYMGFMLNESLDETEQEYLMGALESDPRLSEIFDKVVTTASEFSGAGEVEGPGTWCIRFYSCAIKRWRICNHRRSHQ